MNRKEKLFHDIEINLDTFQFHIKKMKKSDFKLHPIDIDLLKKKTIELYDKLNDLEFDLSENMAGRTINLPERMPKAEIPEKAAVPFITEKEMSNDVQLNQKKETEVEQIDKVGESEQAQEAAEKEKIKAEPIIAPVAAVEEKIENESIKDAIPAQPKEKVIPDQLEEVKEVKQEPPPKDPLVENKNSTRSAFDLFSTDGEATIADKLGSNEEPSIADRMQRSQFNDLRQAIGINEKFLFINELFNGDMGRYNKTIDELNGLKTQQGISTYLFELKIANQWPDDSEALLKLKNLLERKSI